MYEMNVDKLDLLLYSIFYNLLFSMASLYVSPCLETFVFCVSSIHLYVFTF